MSLSAHMIYAALWLSFAPLHSVLAGPRAKAKLQPYFGRGYRFFYNLFALVHIALVIFGGRYLLGGGAASLPLSDLTQQVLFGVMILGIAIFVVALTQYDLGRFSGITQLLQPDHDDVEEPLHVAGPHRFVRHPLYTGAHLYFWGAVRSEFDLATAIYASLYFVIGSHFEEQKLIAIYGDAYRRYKNRVPSVIPWRGRAI